MSQTYANHRRLYAPFHYVLQPILLANLVMAVRRGWSEGTTDAWWGAVMAFGLLVLAATSRMQALTAQNRLIRLEMRLRCEKLLPAELFARFDELGTAQVVALRFAGDGELADLVRRTLAGEFAKAGDIKKAITQWKGDYLRV